MIYPLIVLISLAFAVVFAVIFWISIHNLTKDLAKKGIALSFSSRVIKKRTTPRGLFLDLRNGTNLNPYNLDSEMDQVEIGDSLVKKQGENFCTVYRAGKEIFTVKFIYIQPQ